MALGAVRGEEAQIIVVRGGVDSDLVVKCAAAGVVEFLQNVQVRVPGALAVGGIGGNLFD